MWDQLLNLFGKEGFANLLKTGLDLYSINQAGNQMDFQNQITKDNQRKSNILFDQQQKDDEARRNIDF